ncbi:MAG: hypothetical protein OXN44_11110 [Acidimicrobiaceae bacterium]|nr:hypothetical protein [Acidimicrobiaceae bacterium]MDE0607353.1 hypothetical protein [Acidimicrobiaceae bacterium]
MDTSALLARKVGIDAVPKIELSGRSAEAALADSAVNDDKS